MKKNKRRVYNSKNVEYGIEIKKLLIILGIILLILATIYFIVGIFVTKDIKLFKQNTETTIETTIQYDEILAGETFSKNSNEYYVIFTDSTGNYYSVYKNIVSNNSDKKIYIVDINNPLNTLYISEETNPNAQKASDLKIKDNTMIKISNQKNILYVEDKNEIISYFK